MSELRQDRTNGAWVIIAPERGQRPQRRQLAGPAPDPRPVYDPDCPFCPGNERMMPGIIEEIPADEPPGWRIRVVPNKYPALASDAGTASAVSSISPGYGYHEVIIETWRHNADLVTLAEPDLTALIRSYRHRYAELAAKPAIKSVIVFRNHGRHGGASLAHPHSQVIAMGLTPPRLAAATEWARSHYALHRRCVTCEEIEHEIADGRRVVEATERFLVVVPFAAQRPFEQWICPRRHQSSFGQIDDGELAEFGQILQRALQRLGAVLDNPPYNYVIEPGSLRETDAPYTHWALRIVPALVTPGGFELGSGLPINPSLPESDAEALRMAGAA